MSNIKKLLLASVTGLFMFSSMVVADDYTTFHKMVEQTKKNKELAIRSIQETMIGLINPVGSAGSGFIAEDTSKGMTVLTAAHVVGDKEYVIGFRHDGSRVILYVVKKDEEVDIALLSTNKDSKTTFSSEEVISTFSLGGPITDRSSVLVYGHPKGSIATISSGEVGPFGLAGDRLIVNTSILPGNSGGPVIDDVGDLIGIIIQAVLTPGNTSVEEVSLFDKFMGGTTLQHGVAVSVEGILNFLTKTNPVQPIDFQK